MAGKTVLSRALLLWTVPTLSLLTARGIGAVEWPVDQWEQTVYYQYAFDAAAAGDGLLRITAVDEYEVSFNGAALGTDASWETMEEYAIALERGDNYLAVRVTNHGRGEGSGLLVEVTSAEAESWTSHTRGLEEVWRWTAETPEDDGWLTDDLGNDAAWSPVQRGNLDRNGITAWEDTSGAEIVAGFAGGVDVGRTDGGLTLRTVEGENLALRKPSRRIEVFDGRASTTWTINPDDLNTFASVDLLKRRLVSAVRVLTAGDGPEDFAENSLLGYAVQVSNDGFQWAEVGVIHGITDFEGTEMPLDPILTRHVRVVVAEVDPLRKSRVAEIQVLGDGVAPAGEFISEPLDLGQAGVRKNFGQVSWDADIPEATSISLQFRSADDPDAWSEWSPVTSSGAEILVPEPRSLLQYRVNLETEFEDTAPRLDRLTLEFDNQISVSQALGRVQPNTVVLGRDTLFTYDLDLEFADGDLGVERLRIATPSLPEIEAVTLPAGVDTAGTVRLGDAIEFTFSEPWSTSGTLSVSFHARLLTNQFVFTSKLFAPGASAALNGEEDVSDDPQTGSPRSWSVRATDVTGSLLSEVRASPEVITPNGDGANDDTVIELTLSRVSEPQVVEIGIYDLGGRLVRELPVGRLTGGQYVRPPGGGAFTGAPGLVWDGRDAAGSLVPPGLYLIRVSAQLGRGDETVMRTIAVIY